MTTEVAICRPLKYEQWPLRITAFLTLNGPCLKYKRDIIMYMYNV